MTRRFSLVLWSSDVPALARFLREVTEAQVEEAYPGFAALRIAGVRVEIHDDEAYQGHPWYDALRREGLARGVGAEIRVEVADVAEAVRRARSLGAAIVQPPYHGDGFVEAVVMAPDGYLITLWGAAADLEGGSPSIR